MSKNALQLKPLVSIIVPFYNSFDSISRCIDSIRNQIYKNYEVIIVDDGSAESFSKKYDFFLSSNTNYKCLTHSRNMGVSAARNSGVVESKGELIFFLDADDWLSENALYNLLKNSYIGADLFVAPHNQYLSQGNIKKKSYLVEENKSLLDQNFIHKYVVNYLYLPYEYVMFVHCWNKLYSAKIIKENGILFNTELSQLEDVNFNFNYLKFVNLISFSNTYDYFHYIEKKSNSASGLAGSEKSSVKKCVTAFNAVKEYLELNKKINDIQKLKLLRHHFCSTAVIYLIRMTKTFINKPSLSKYNSIKKWVESPQLKSSVSFYIVQKGESSLIKLGIQSGSVSLFIFVCFFRIQFLKLRAKLDIHR